MIISVTNKYFPMPLSTDTTAYVEFEVTFNGAESEYASSIEFQGLMFAFYWNVEGDYSKYHLARIDPRTPYESWPGNTAGSQLCSVEFPANIGDSKTWTTNWRGESNRSSSYTNLNYFVETSVESYDIVEFTLTKLTSTSYRLEFVRRYNEDYTIETSVPLHYKTLKTTVERNDGTRESSSSPISGLVQNISTSVQTDFVKVEYDAVPTSYEITAFINDSSAEELEES